MNIFITLGPDVYNLFPGRTASESLAVRSPTHMNKVAKTKNDRFKYNSD